jgi:transposase-like protein
VRGETSESPVKYTESFKAKMVQRMLPPNGRSANALSRETGVNQASLSRWLKHTRKLSGMSDDSKKWTAAEKLRVVVAASGLDDSKLGELLRREGLHEATLAQWRSDAEAALTDVPRTRKTSRDSRRIKELEREVHRKDKALAEVTALLVLKKKVDALWGDGDDDISEKKGR